MERPRREGEHTAAPRETETPLAETVHGKARQEGTQHRVAAQLARGLPARERTAGRIAADRSRALVGILTVGTWNGRTWKGARHYVCTSDDDARAVVRRIEAHQNPGRLSVHITALAASPRMRAAIVRDVADQVAHATRAHPERRGLLWVLSWYTRPALEAVA